MNVTSTKTAAIETRLLARSRAKAWAISAEVPSSTPQMCVEREIAAALELAAAKCEELLAILDNGR